ncbi:MAG: S9 family peptidase [Saprospiraceae bacterium]|nr:S9 family peptidase [Saprospiraceae bacterium]
MKKLNLILIFALICLTTSFAQKKLLQIDDAMKNASVYPASMNQIQWMGETDYFTFVEKNNLYQRKASQSSDKKVYKLEEINKALNEYDLEALKRFPQINWVENNAFLFDYQNNIFIYNVDSKVLKKANSYPEKAEGVEIADHTNFIAYTKENNLFISINGEEIAVTNDENTGIKNGQTVHRSEFGIEDGIFWSPSGKLLAFYRKDETIVTDYPLVDIESRVASLENTKYPMAGETNEEVTVGIYYPESKKTIFLKTGEPKTQYLTNVTWSPDEKQIYIAVLNRDQNHMKLNVYDSQNGDFIKTLFEEKNERYVEPEHGPIFLPENNDKFLWYSERDGWNHLYLYNTKGELIKQLTKGNWLVTDFLGFDKGDENAYFMSTIASPIEDHLCSVNLKSSKINKITSKTGTHNILLSVDKKYAIDIYSSTTVAREYLLLDNKGKVIQTLQENVDPLKDYNLGKTEIFTIKAEDGTELYCRMIKPMNFDAKKKYPVLVYVYGGPHAQMITDSWLGGAGLWLNYMAQQGYLIWTLDNRGSANRGFEFESCIHRNLGTLEVEDQMAGVEYLKTLPYVDAKRIGVDGWSYGGFMTISLMLKNPGVFKVGCAGGPVIDWKWYEIMYGERYMDTPQDNPDGYKNASLLNYVDKLDGRLLLIHGTMDPTVVWQNSLAFIKKCVDEEKLVDYFVYPGHEHNVRGMDRVHLWRKIEQYFDDNLK